MGKDINYSEAKEAYERGGVLFEEYLNIFGGPEGLVIRANELLGHLRDNELSLLAMIFKHAEPLKKSLDDMDEAGEPKEVIESFLTKIFIIFLDCLDHAGFIKAGFLPEELDIKKDFKKEFSIEFPKAIIEKVKKDKKKKKNGKK